MINFDLRSENTSCPLTIQYSYNSSDDNRSGVGIVVLNKNNKVVSFPGGSAPSYVDKTLIKPKYDQISFRNPHDICVDDDWNLYVPQWNSGKTYPVKLTRI